MPKANLTQDDILKENVRMMIKAFKAKYNLDNKALADAMGISTQTLSRRQQNPGSFTLSEMRKLRQKLRIPKEKMPLPGDN